ncbi:hyperosmolality-gated Ca2+ permeable channel 2.4-like [Bidens hawaiensis]|uniref:hyperosmolality-gated Ca2+ permeable channel 2.4-like n=1 Tax=Bidens hawaiensis TaxID=980011 RepID=UPI004049A5A7
MIISGLLTSVAINFALCVIFFTLYSILSRQPGNYKVFIPRLLHEGMASVRRPRQFHLSRLLPTAGWIKNAWHPTEDQLLAYSGLDAVVFMRIITFSFKVFTIAGFVGIFILIPVNCSGNQLQDVDFINLTNNTLEVFSISNVNNGSDSLWIHLGAVYFVTLITCYFLFSEYKYISSKRIDYFCSSKPQPHQFTILVSNIPVSKGISVGTSVDNFFTENHPDTYLSHVVVHRKSKVWTVAHALKKLYKKIFRIKKASTQQMFTRDGFLNGSNVKVKKDKSREEVRAAFVSFKSRYGAAVALHMLQSNNPTEWRTEQAPEPQDVYWPFFSSTFMRRWISRLVVILSCALLTIIFLIPVFIVQGLTNLAQLEAFFPFLTGILTISIVSQVITGYLPNLILQMSLKIIPPTMKLLSSQQGYVCNSDIERSACHKVIWFTVWNVFFANVLSASAFGLLSIFLEVKDIPSKLAVSVPAQASFFIAYVVTLGWTSTSSELFRVVPFIISLICKPFTKNSDEVTVPSFPYHKDIPKILFFGLLGFTYFFLAPLIIPFLLIYFALAYIIYRNQMLYVYAPKYESAGKFWPIVHDTTIFSLVLMQFIAFGIFKLKKLPYATSVTIPLPVITLLFNEYCRKRFLPIFCAYSTETLRKKDREDQSLPEMPHLLRQLSSAYQDPALVPLSYSSNHSSLREPLIPVAEVR